MNNEELKVLIFSVGNNYYATDIMEIERILGYEEPTKLPDSPEFLEGVMNYEGNILPVISLNKKFAIESKEKSADTKIIVAKQNDYKTGIIVDLVLEVKDVKKENIEDAPQIVGGISKRYIKGLIKIDKKIIIFLNLATILTEDERRQMHDL
ncbi:MULTISPECIES: chemotaxis protein CheW [unclassified Clostridium]|uniref:chemotaxis protein CheW n=1 Tax=unclassified Clostridium TaxID=2614128 RepID=UPI00052C799A|nr:MULTISPECIES: chemotaxis protein CheW [unclassified Clostridium]KGK86040.1 chemotaxis protein CheW [Clostridium sp. HMP27]